MLSAQRNTKSRQIFREDVSSGDSDEDYDSGDDSRSVTTGGNKPRALRTTTLKQKGKQPQKRRYAGKLSKLLDMPLDVLYEIFSLLHPVDLLWMSRASKAFRNVLTSKSSRQVWMAAFNNVPEARRPPPCPEELTEIAYAGFLYDPRCNSCGASRAPMYWMVLARLCTSCIKNRVTGISGAKDQPVVPLSGSRLCTDDVLPSFKVTSLPKKLYVFTKDLEQLTEDLEAVIKRYRDAFVAKCEFGQALERLRRMEEADREAVLTAAHERRIEQILERLADKGWGEEISSHRNAYVKSIIEVKGVKLARPLAEKAWEEMEDRVLDAMQKCKDYIIYRDHYRDY